MATREKRTKTPLDSFPLVSFLSYRNHTPFLEAYLLAVGISIGVRLARIVPAFAFSVALVVARIGGSVLFRSAGRSAG